MKNPDIIATVSCNPESNTLPVVINNLICSGIRSFRINVGRNKLGEIINAVKTIRDISNDVNIILDVSFPKAKVRIKKMESPDLYIKEGEIYKFENYQKMSDGIGIEYFGKYKKLIGRHMIYGDGFGAFTITHADDYSIRAVAKNSFKMVLGKSLFFKEFNYINENDSLYKELQSLVDFVSPEYVAFSFVEKVEDIMYCKKILRNTNIKIMCKLETFEGIKNANEIAKNCDSVILGRGDLGITAPIYEINNYQELLAKNIGNGMVKKYVATDVMSSMKDRFQPSRSDVVDMAKIVSDGYEGVILPAFVTDKDNVSETIRLIRKIYEFTRKGNTDE